MKYLHLRFNNCRSVESGEHWYNDKRLSAVLLVICVQGVVERWRQFGRGINETSIIVGSESLTDICLHFDKYKHLHCNPILHGQNREQCIEF
jgi:hypothetical protein